MDQQLIADAKAARHLSDIVRQVVALNRHAGEWRGLCPFHVEKTPSFYVNDQKQFYHCFGCGAHGDAIDFVMRADGVNFAEAITHLMGSDLHLPRHVQVARDHAVLAEEEDEQRRRKLAHETWMKREPAAGSLAEKYLRILRKITIRLPDQLGFVPECYDGKTKRAYPALIAAIQDRTGAVTAIQRIFLDMGTGDAVKIEVKPGKWKRHKATLGPQRDGCVRLGMPYHDTLGLAGSVEDALSAMELFSIPVWATCGETRFSSVWLPDHIKRVLIFGDGDEAGQRESRKAADRIYQRHMTGQNTSSIDVSVMDPPKGKKDWNDVLRGEAT